VSATVSDDAQDLHQVLRARRDKLAALREKGIHPFAYSFDVTDTAANAIAAFEEDETGAPVANGQGATTRLGGRVVGWRDMGKSAFAHIEDRSGRIQLYFRRDVLGDESFENLALLDLGDWIGVAGDAFRTKTGEVTLRVQGWTLLTKSLRLSFMNMPLLTYIAEISPRPIFFIHGEKAHSRYFSETAYAAAAEPKELVIVPGAVHVDLYDQMDKIPFDKLTAFFKQHLAGAI
jgi:hypothetical protein